MMTLATRLKTLREDMGLTQTALAKKAKVSQPTISLYESGKPTEYRAHILMKIAAALETTPEYLMTGMGEKSIGKVQANRAELSAILSRLNDDSIAALLIAAKAMK